MQRKRIAVHVDLTGFKIHNKIRKTDDRIVKIDAVDIDNPENEFHQIINPEHSISREASKCHGITQKEVKGQPNFAKVGPKFKKFIKDAEIVTHNATSTLHALNTEFTRLEGGTEKRDVLQAPVTDVMKIDKALHPKAKTHKLQDMRERLDVSPKAGDKSKQIAAIFDKLSTEEASAVHAHGLFSPKVKSAKLAPAPVVEREEKKSARKHM